MTRVIFRIFLVSAFTLSPVYSQALPSCSNGLGVVSIVAFNTLNLFDDTLDGDKKYDLPPGYNQEVVDDKVKRLKDVVTQGGKCLPDVACAVEVENENAAHQLASALGYKYMFLSKSPDERGIDVALFFNTSTALKSARFRNEYTYRSDEFKDSPSRNVLLVDLDVQGKHLILVVVHWPSMRNPVEKSAAAALETRRIVEDQLRKFPEATVAVLGDFNSIPSVNTKDGKNPFDDILLKGDGTGPQLFNARTKADPEVLKKQVPGTYFFHKTNQWNELDRVAIFEGPHLTYDPKSYLVYAHPDYSEVHPQSGGAPVPIGYFFKFEGGKLVSRGASDHYPVYVQFKVK